MAGKKKRSVGWLFKACEPDTQNLATDLTTEELEQLGQEVVKLFELDKKHRASWDQLSESAMKLAQQVKEAKTFPWENCSNVKHPLITVAAIQFAARAYPEIVKGDRIVKCKITGDEPPIPLPPQAQSGLPQSAGPQPPSQLPAGPVPAGPGPMQGAGLGPAGPPEMNVPGQAAPPGQQIPKTPKQDRAGRIEVHMNYQLSQEMPEWDEDCDRSLHILPVIGQHYKKTYFGEVNEKKRNISELVLPAECYVNSKAKSIKKARRITHCLWFYQNDIYEKIKGGRWLDPGDLGKPVDADADEDDAPHEFLEQHCFKDLDGDGYKEPYIVTVHKQTRKVVRVLARWQPEGVQVVSKNGGMRVASIEPDQYFTHFQFIPNPDGSMNALGFGQLLEPLNSSVNAVLNQLIDAGTLYNTGGGFIGRGVRLRGGEYRFRPGEWKLADTQGANLKESIVQLPVREPSAVLFQLLGFLVQAGKEISSVQDILTGDAKLAANMPVGTAMALVEQGLKVFTAIYKRVYRSLTEEFMKLYRLNSLYLNPDVTFVISGKPGQFRTGQSDYQTDDLLVVPIADPSLSSDMQRLLKAQALKDLSQRPGLDEVEITRRLVAAINPDNKDSLLLTDGQIAGTEPVRWKPPPPPQMVVAQAKAVRLQQQAQEANVRLQMDMLKFQVELAEMEARIGNVKADTMLKLAKTEDTGRADHLELYKAEVDRLTAELKMKMDLLTTMTKQMGQSGQPSQAGSAGPAKPPAAAAAGQPSQASLMGPM